MGKIEEAHNKGIEINTYFYATPLGNEGKFGPQRNRLCATGAFVLGEMRDSTTDVWGLEKVATLTGKSYSYARGISHGFFGSDGARISKKGLINLAKNQGYAGEKPSNAYDSVEGIRLGIRLHDECMKRGYFTR